MSGPPPSSVSLEASADSAIGPVKQGLVSSIDSPAATVRAVPAATARYYYMDSMRAMLMMLGVVLHAAYIFSPGEPWVVSDPQSSDVLGVFSHYMRMFRMPAFFVISGFFSLMSLQRYDAGTFLRVRLKRIVIPLISAGLTLNVAQLYYQERVLDGRATSLPDFLLHVLPRQILAGAWVQHLWFLNTLIFYFIAAVFIYRLAPPFVQKWKDSRILDLLRRRCRFMLLLPFLLMGWNVVEHFGHGWADTTLFCGILNLDELIIYLPYFLLGLWLYVDPKLQEEFHCLDPWQAFAFVVSVSLYSQLRGAHGFHLSSLVQHYCETLYTLICTQICFIGFRRYANNDSRLFRYLADASYTVYLFHHVCVVIFGTWLLQVTLLPELKFLLILSASLLVTLAIHHFLILRVPVLRLMYNGK